MPKFNYDDIVTANRTAPLSSRPGSKAWVVGVFETRRGEFLRSFPEGVVYVVEFEDGASTEVTESQLELYIDPES